MADEKTLTADAGDAPVVLLNATVHLVHPQTQETWCYNYDLLTLEQAVKAYEVFVWRHEASMNPQARFSVFRTSGMDNSLIVALSYLLTREGVPYGDAQPGLAEKFLKSLPASVMRGSLEGIMMDFFTRHDKANLESLRQRVLMTMPSALAVERFQQIVHAGISSTQSNDENEHGTQESATDA